MSAFIDITGQRFGRLLVLYKIGKNKHNLTLWLCQCDCSKTIVTDVSSLRTGNTKSCGCTRAASVKAAVGTHGASRTPMYRAWATMKSRCYNSNFPKWTSYGARGITVCDRWHKFENFLADMGTRPPGKSIDRINNDGN